jgi:hypothetical protein
VDNRFSLDGFKVAVLTSQPFSLLSSTGALLVDQCPANEARLYPLPHDPEIPMDTFCGMPCAPAPVFQDGTRELTTEELACDAVIVTMIDRDTMVRAIRAAGFTGAIYAPGRVIPRPDGKKNGFGQPLFAAHLGDGGLYMVAPSQRGGFTSRTGPSDPDQAKFD